MAKYTLSLEDDFNYDLIGLCSHHGDYRVCWSINERIGLRLQKSLEPFMVSGKKGVVNSSHSLYEVPLFYRQFAFPDALVFFFLYQYFSELDKAPIKQ